MSLLGSRKYVYDCWIKLWNIILLREEWELVGKGVVKELNNYLKGEYMAIHAYEHYIYHTKDVRIKAILQSIQQEHKEHAARIADRIQNLGEKAVMDNGVKLSVMETMMKIKVNPVTTEEILQGVIKGQKKGIQATEELVRGDLDQESFQLVAENLSQDREHIEQLQNLLR